MSSAAKAYKQVKNTYTNSPIYQLAAKYYAEHQISSKDLVSKLCFARQISVDTYDLNLKSVLIKLNDSDSGANDNENIKALTSLSKPSNIHIMNVGSPISCISICPMVEGNKHTYIAVGCMGNQGDQNSPRVLGEIADFPNCIQLWETNQTSTSFMYSIMISSAGPIWDLKWLPIASLTSATIIGLLAVVLGTGECVVYMIPKLAACMSTPTGQGSSVDIAHMPIVRAEELYRWSISYPTGTNWTSNTEPTSSGNANAKLTRIGVNCICWRTEGLDRKDGYELLCGMMDGTWSSWFISMPENNIQPGTCVELQPTRIYYDTTVDNLSYCVAAISCMEICPFNSQLVVTGSYSGCINIWNTDINTGSNYQPVYHKKHWQPIGWILDVHFDPFGYGLYFCGSDSPTIFYDTLWNIGTNSGIHQLYSHPNPASCVWKFAIIVVDGQAMCCSICSSGIYLSCIVASAITRRKQLLLSFQGQIIQDDQGFIDVYTAPVLWTSKDAKLPSLKVNHSDANSLFVVATGQWLGGHGQKDEHLIAYGGTSGLLVVQNYTPDCMIK